MNQLILILSSFNCYKTIAFSVKQLFKAQQSVWNYCLQKPSPFGDSDEDFSTSASCYNDFYNLIRLDDITRANSFQYDRIFYRWIMRQFELATDLPTVLVGLNKFRNTSNLFEGIDELMQPSINQLFNLTSLASEFHY